MGWLFFLERFASFWAYAPNATHRGEMQLHEGGGGTHI